MAISLYNSLKRQLEPFTPINDKKVGMYVCGPTVYNRPHIGNARAVVVFDLLYRLLRHTYGEKNVTYVRNITDVDDKIIAAAKQNNESIPALTKRVTEGFHEDMDVLSNLRPDVEPTASTHIAEMVQLIERLIANGNAYVADGHVLFAVNSVKSPHYAYGQLSGKKLDDLIAGARVEVEGYKRDAGDFVLWKPADAEDDDSALYDSPFGKGRPGWHIECSAMSGKYLGQDFDIHGGGADLKFPHHENEIAQSCCGNAGSMYARTWVHNGFLTVNGEKMSKSLGNFITVEELRAKGVKGEAIRYVLLSTHYAKPLDWTDKSLSDANDALTRFYRALSEAGDVQGGEVPFEFISALEEDLNTPKALAVLHNLVKTVNKAGDAVAKTAAAASLKACGQFLGLLADDPANWIGGNNEGDDAAEIDALVQARIDAKAAKNFAEADRIRNELTARGIVLEDKPGNVTQWKRA